VSKTVPTVGVVSDDTTTAATATTATGAATGAGTAGSEKAKPVVGVDDKLLLLKSDTPVQGDLPIDTYINKLSCAF
jgi:hypothetical protein